MLFKKLQFNTGKNLLIYFYNFLKKKFYYNNKFLKFLIFIFFYIITKCLNIFNLKFGKYIDLGSGLRSGQLFWINYDYLINKFDVNDPKWNIKNKNIELVYSSHFLEHISDTAVTRVFHNSYNVLKKNGVLRIVVPNQKFFINLYKNNDIDGLKRYIGPLNLATWEVYNTNTESPEQLLVAAISTIHNNVYIEKEPKTFYEKLENFYLGPKLSRSSFRSSLKGYYCGPPIYIKDDLIKKKFSTLSEQDFIDFILKLQYEPDTLKITDSIFKTWHINDWSFEKIYKFGKDSNFSKIERSNFLDKRYNFLVSKNRENINHKNFSLYVNLYK